MSNIVTHGRRRCKPREAGICTSAFRRSADESLPTGKRSQSKNEHLFSAAAGIKSSADRLRARIVTTCYIPLAERPKLGVEEKETRR